MATKLSNHSTTYLKLLIYSAVVACLALSCSTKSIKSLPPDEHALPTRYQTDVYPYDLQVESLDGSMILRWKKAGTGLYSGYFIFIGEEPTGQRRDTTTPFNFEPFAGDTNPDDSIETFTAEHLTNGRKYYVTVKAIFPDRSLSAPTNEVMTVCGPRVQIELAPRFNGTHDGYSLGKNTFVKADDAANDFYYYTKEGADYLASPHRLNGYLRKTTFSSLEFSGELRDFAPRLAEADPQPAGEKIDLRAGQWILITTADNTYAVAKVLDISGTSSARRVRLYVAYCPAVGELIF